MPLLFVGAGQLGAVLPFDLSGVDTTRIQVTSGGKRSNVVEVGLRRVSPGIFTLDGRGLGEAAALRQDGSIIGWRNPARRGGVIQVYATGLGPYQPPISSGAVATSAAHRVAQAVEAYVGGVPSEVVYAGGAPGLVAGATQVNLKVPTDGTVAGEVPLLIKADGVESQGGVRIWVESRP